jgi:hypothetical protein
MLAAFRAFTVIVVAGLTLALAAPSSAQDGRLLAKHQAAGQACAACHRESPPSKKPAAAICQSCHGDQSKLAAATSKADPNPHAPPHLAAGESQVCGDCHSVHKQSDITCTDCHRGFNFNVK